MCDKGVESNHAAQPSKFHVQPIHRVGLRSGVSAMNTLSLELSEIWVNTTSILSRTSLAAVRFCPAVSGVVALRFGRPGHCYALDCGSPPIGSGMINRQSEDTGGPVATPALGLLVAQELPCHLEVNKFFVGSNCTGITPSDFLCAARCLRASACTATHPLTRGRRHGRFECLTPRRSCSDFA